mmetsp:Transcript_22287/g.63953  ORF Transcript_22287/g.63953 Transcript_22287/m.63953 type:complete len:273 (-) Transcript_22287:771-1589(-)
MLLIMMMTMTMTARRCWMGDRMPAMPTVAHRRAASLLPMPTPLPRHHQHQHRPPPNSTVPMPSASPATRRWYRGSRIPWPPGAPPSAGASTGGPSPGPSTSTIPAWWCSVPRTTSAICTSTLPRTWPSWAMPTSWHRGARLRGNDCRRTTRTGWRSTLRPSSAPAEERMPCSRQRLRCRTVSPPPPTSSGNANRSSTMASAAIRRQIRSIGGPPAASSTAAPSPCRAWSATTTSRPWRTRRTTWPCCPSGESGGRTLSADRTSVGRSSGTTS